MSAATPACGPQDGRAGEAGLMVSQGEKRAEGGLDFLWPRRM